MFTLKLKNGTILTFDPNTLEVKVNGKVDKNWEPMFIELPDNVNSIQFYGFIDNKNKLTYNLDGDIEPIETQENINDAI